MGEMRLRLGNKQVAVVLVGCCVFLLLRGVTAQDSSGYDQPRALRQFNQAVQPLLKKLCYQCHGPETQESDLRIDLLDPDMVDGEHGGKWREVLDALNRGDMPPEDQLQPNSEQRDALIQWITSELEYAAMLRRSTGGHVTLRRLTRYEYQNTMRDLLGIDLDYVKDLPPDTRGADGYKNNGVYMGMSEAQLEAYYNAAKRGLEAAIVQGEPKQRIHQKITKSATKLRFDNLVPAQFDSELEGTIVGFNVSDPKKKKSAAKRSAMVLLCLDKLPEKGAFRVRIKASATEGDPQFSPPRMLVEIGHKTGVKVEPSRTAGEVDVTSTRDDPEVFEFTGRLEEYPLHTGNTTKKFPGLRVIITDINAIAPKAPSPGRKSRSTEPTNENRPKLVVHWVEFETPVDLAWPPLTHTQILPPRNPDVAENQYVREVLERFMSRAFRRPATEEEIEWAIRYYNKVRPTMNSLEETMREVLALVLVSPKFLYLPEYQTKQANTKRIRLTDYELAARLSYFLWGTMPDARLRTLAEEGKLNHHDALEMEVARLLTDDRSWRFVEGFAGQWLKLDGVDAVAVNPETFPTFDERLKKDMKQESLHFFAAVLRHKRSCLNFLDSDFVVVNDRLADFYGIERPGTSDFRRSELPADSVRGGVLTQASFLLGNSTGAQSHPVYRAKWFLDRVMGTPPGDPPADVPELDETTASDKQRTIKQQLELHRERKACNHCHRNLDPWGIPFEEFNAIGQHIPTQSKARNVGNQSESVLEETVLPDGTTILGSRELIMYLMKNKRREFAQGFTRHLLTYALGRSLEWTDQPLIDQLADDFHSNDYRMDRLILNIVQSDAFRMK